MEIDNLVSPSEMEDLKSELNVQIQKINTAPVGDSMDKTPGDLLHLFCYMDLSQDVNAIEKQESKTEMTFIKDLFMGY